MAGQLSVVIVKTVETSASVFNLRGERDGQLARGHGQSFMATEEKALVTNRAAFHEYHIEAKYEAGVALTGTEVKSVRAGQVQLKESYVAVRGGEAWLFNAHISPYAYGNRENHDPTRVYLKRGRVKLEIGVARGKKLYDKRETEMRRTVERETRAQLKERNR